MKILVTGAAGFIGSFLCKRLLERGDVVVGLDNINNYYSIDLKYGRLGFLGVEREEIEWGKCVKSSLFPNFSFIKMNLEDEQQMSELFAANSFDIVVNLAAQAGVRYSIENPQVYAKSNICGFLNILEGCRNCGVKHLVFASSSSVYGLNSKVPFSEKDAVDHPVSLYAATKKANELMAHTYSHLYNIPSTGLRFFTVYGPWGRPDMSPFLFSDAILNNRTINVFNNGDMLRDFTYIDDIIEGVVRVIDSLPQPNSEWNGNEPDASSSTAPYKIYNIGNSQPIKLMDFIAAIEEAIGRKAEKIYLPMQPGDVYQTNADTTLLRSDFNFAPNKSIVEGVKETIAWYKSFYKLD